MPGLIDFAPSAATLLEIEPEDLGLIIITLINQTQPSMRNFTASHFIMPLLNANVPAYPQHSRREIARAGAEAWQWLQSQGLTMPDPETQAYRNFYDSEEFRTCTKCGTVMPAPAAL